MLERGREPLRRAVASGPCHRDAWPDGQQAGQGRLLQPSLGEPHVLLEPSAVPVRAAEGLHHLVEQVASGGQVDELALQKQREPLGVPTSDVLESRDRLLGVAAVVTAPGAGRDAGKCHTGHSDSAAELDQLPAALPGGQGDAVHDRGFGAIGDPVRAYDGEKGGLDSVHPGPVIRDRDPPVLGAHGGTAESQDCREPKEVTNHSRLTALSVGHGVDGAEKGTARAAPGHRPATGRATRH